MKLELKYKRIEHLFKKLTNSFSGTDLKFIEAKLDTGETVKADGEELIIGATLFKVAEDGSETPAPDGTYNVIVDDKTYSVVIEAGIIADVQEVKTDTSEQSKEQPKTEEPKATEDSKAYTKEINSLKEQIKGLKESQENLFEVVKTITKMGSVKPTEPVTKVTAKSMISEDEKFEAMAKVLQQYKK